MGRRAEQKPVARKTRLFPLSRHCCPCKLCGRQVVQRTAWTLFVVILPPSFDLSSCVTETGEPVRVQAFIAQATTANANQMSIDWGIVYNQHSVFIRAHETVPKRGLS